MRATEEAEEFVEAPLERMKLRLVAQMRFTEPPGRVADRLQPVGNGRLLE